MRTNVFVPKRVIAVFVSFWMVCAAADRVRADTEPAEVQQVREVIKDNGRAIVYFALPTYTYVGTGYNDFRRLGDGYELTFTFECKSHWRTNTMRLAFYLDKAGQFDWCRVLRHTSYWTPFTDAVGKKQLAKLRAFMVDYPAVRDSRQLLHTCESATPKEMCELYLKLEQARRKAAATTAATGKEPLQAMLAQVAPMPARPTDFVRSPKQTRAVVILHGLRPEFDRFLSTRAVLQDFQEPDSFLVKILARDADVFAFAYGQNVPLEQIADAAELGQGLARLRRMNYADIVLVGFSAGGLIARQFVEDHAHAGVTKVVQVCAPNGGVLLAKVAPVLFPGQKAFIASLTTEGRRQCQRGRQSTTIPERVEFFCIVGEAVAKCDWVVPFRSQWSEDLQSQGVPAVRIHATHLNVVEEPESIQVIARAVREPAPRWDRQRLLVERHGILKE